jgi:hypothetical protein
LSPTAAITMMLMPARPTIQAAAKAGPSTRARGVASIRTTATIGSGLTAMPTPKGRIWPIASPTGRASSRGRAARARIRG